MHLHTQLFHQHHCYAISLDCQYTSLHFNRFQKGWTCSGSSCHNKQGLYRSHLDMFCQRKKIAKQETSTKNSKRRIYIFLFFLSAPHRPFFGVPFSLGFLYILFGIRHTWLYTTSWHGARLIKFPCRSWWEFEHKKSQIVNVWRTWIETKSTVTKTSQQREIESTRSRADGWVGEVVFP